jgi:hypothetical protein
VRSRSKPRQGVSPSRGIVVANQESSVRSGPGGALLQPRDGRVPPNLTDEELACEATWTEHLLSADSPRKDESALLIIPLDRFFRGSVAFLPEGSPAAGGHFELRLAADARG